MCIELSFSGVKSCIIELFKIIISRSAVWEGKKGKENNIRCNTDQHGLTHSVGTNNADSTRAQSPVNVQYNVLILFLCSSS